MSSFRYNINHVSSSSRSSGLLSSQKSIYDGVFGGAPRSGLANALAPRLEDYAEIFGSRSCSIPLLEVPVIDGCDSRLLHFDYSEVFGEYGNNFMAMSSFQELLDGGDCGYEGDYHPWSPEQSGSISDEFDRLARAEKSPISSDADSLRSSELFNESDSKHTPNRMSHVSNSEASVHCSKHETRDDDIIRDKVAGERIMENEQDSRFSPVRLSRIASSKSHRNDDYELAQDKPFITVSDISLRTKPSGLPPPSRAPPALTVKRRVRPEISNIKKNRAESDAGREVNASESSQEMNTNKNIETTSRSAKETSGKDEIWSSITWDMEDFVKVEEGEDSVPSPCHEERERSSISIEKHSDLQGVHCSTHTGDNFVGIVSWREETDYYEVFEGNNAATEAFETIEDFSYSMQQRSSDDHMCQRTVDSVALNEKQNPKLGIRKSPIQNVGTNQIERISNELQWSQEKQLFNYEKLKKAGPKQDYCKKIPELVLQPDECEDNVIDDDGIVMMQENAYKNELKETFDLKRYVMGIEEADEHEETDEESFEAIPCEKDILCKLPREGQKCKEMHEEGSDHGFYDLKYVGNSKEQKLSEVNENEDALKRENGYFSPGKEAYCNKVLEANMHLNVDPNELEAMSNQDEEMESIDKNDNVREVSDDAFIDLASPAINGNFLNPLEAEGAVRCEGNQTSKVLPTSHTYESHHVIDNPLFNVKLNRPTKTEDEDGTSHRVSQKIVTTKGDGDQEMKTNESVTSVNSSKESVDVRKMERAPSTSEQNDNTRHSKIATRGINAKINFDQESESNLEHDYLRKLEEEKEREREREKDRMDVNTVVLEAREKLYAEKSSTEARHKAMADARERLEKASTEGRLRAERAAVERATAEARQRATEKLISEKTSYNTRDRLQQSVSEKFATSAKYDDMRQRSLPSDLRGTEFSNGSRHNAYFFSAPVGAEGESPQRCKARLERYRRTAERAANALAEKNKRDLLAQREKEERNRVAEVLDPEVRRWANGKEGNLRALLSTLQYILGPESGWQPVPLTKIITSAAVKTAYRKATLCVHPDKLQQRGATVQQKYVCEKVFDLLKEAWNKFSSEERC